MNIVILGGVAAGTKVAAKLMRQNRNNNVTIYTKSKDISYAGCGLPYHISGLIPDKDSLVVNTPEKFSMLTGVNVKTEMEAIKIDPNRKSVLFKDNTEVNYDKLVIATGATPIVPNIEGVDRPNVFTLRTVEDAVNIIRKQISQSRKPICGICMGNQLLYKAAGATIYKLKYGHRSHNQPVRMVGTNNCYITSQNHGYAVDAKTLDNDWEELFVNMNDGSNEGIRHKVNPWFSSQFHPEACSGPVDTEFMFDKFVETLKH